MTNKPMLSVERELLERAVFNMPFCDTRYDLQSILDTPVIGRKPVAWLVEDIYGQKKALRAGAEGIERHRKSGSTLIPLFDNAPSHNVVCECWYTDECGNIRYRPEEVKPAPVADHTQCEECKGWGYHENHHEGGGTECGECGGSGKATVAVVMVIPDRVEVEPFTTIDRGSKNYKAGYNAAIAEVAKLNRLNP